jgi:heterodisulfide reductase subunit B
MCQLNLDAYQGSVNKYFRTSFHVPVVFFTQLVGIALGIPMKDLGFGMEIVAASPVIEAKLAAPAASV